jgi:pyruvate formate lyase activating enzyme
MSDARATITELHSLSTHDGPGLRTTVFFKGCPLRCLWCQNPETIDPRPHLEWTGLYCLHCGDCTAACAGKLIAIGKSGMDWNSADCERCGDCVAACPSGALSMTGREVSPEELLAEVKKDAPFFKNSDGGVTLSGGEPLFQPEFATRFAALCQAEGISVALDTCGAVPLAVLDAILPFVDLLLYDIKLIDEQRHRHYTGQSNHLTLDNLASLLERPAGDVPAIWIRTPLIPGMTATADNISAIANFLLDHHHESLQLWELCAFNNLCRDRYRRMGLDWGLAEEELLKDGELAELRDIACGILGGQLEVITTGITRKS